MQSPEKRDLDLTRAQLCAWLARQIPGAGDVRIHGLSAPAEAGASNETLLLDAEWTIKGRAHLERLVLRLKPPGMTLFLTYEGRPHS